MTGVRSFSSAVADRWVRRAVERAEAGDHEGALDCYNSALEVVPDDAWLLCQAAQALMRLDRMDDAEAALRTARGLRGGEPEAPALLALLYSRYQTRGEEAEAALEGLAERFPDDRMVRLATADLLSVQDRFSEADGIFLGLLAEDAEDADVLEGLAVACNREAFRQFHDGEPERALFILKRAMDTAPHWIGLRVNRGRFFEAMGKADKARGEYLAALEGDPDDPIALFNLGRLARESGRPEEALRSLQAVLDLDDDYPDARPELAGVLHDQERYAEAVEVLEAELQRDPACAVCRHNLGLAHYKAGALEPAVQCFREALTEDSGYFRAHYNLAAALARSGEADGALTALEDAHQLEPTKTRDWLEEDLAEFSLVASSPRFRAMLRGESR